MISNEELKYISNLLKERVDEQFKEIRIAIQKLNDSVDKIQKEIDILKEGDRI